MYDGIKYNLSDFAEEVFTSNPKITFRKVIIEETGEIQYPYLSYSDCFYFKLNPVKRFVSGSLHKCYNSVFGFGEQNYDKFTIEKLKSVIEHIHKKFRISSSAPIVNLEIGVNISTKVELGKLLRTNLIGFNFQLTPKQRNFKDGGYYIEFKFKDGSKIIYKLYDKGSQYELKDSVLRWEIRLIRSDLIFKKLGIRTNEDLFNDASIERVKELLLFEWDKLVIIDDYDISNLEDPEEKLFYKDIINMTYWTKLKAENRHRFYRNRNKAKEFIKKYNLDSLQKELRKSIERELDYLSICNKKHDFLNNNTFAQNDLGTTNNTVDIGVNSYNSHYSLNDDSIKKQVNKKGSICLVTGIDISNQRKGSRFLSKTTILRIYQIDKPLFLKLKKEFLKKDVNCINEIAENIAHSIRDKKANLDKAISRRKAKSSQFLFPLEEDKLESEYFARFLIKHSKTA